MEFRNYNGMSVSKILTAKLRDSMAIQYDMLLIE